MVRTGGSRDLNTRMAHLMGAQGLRYLFMDPARGYARIRKPNAAFEGQSALQLLLRGEVSDLAALRDRLDMERSERVRAGGRASDRSAANRRNQIVGHQALGWPCSHLPQRWKPLVGRAGLPARSHRNGRADYLNLSGRKGR